MQKKPKIIFFQIKKLTDKLSRITKTAKLHFDNKKQLIFLTHDDKSQNYLDELLWKEPLFSFLPHSISKVINDDLIIITQETNILNEVNYIFNLSPLPLLNLPSSIIYEFDDTTDKQKLTISKNKFKTYKNQGYLIESK